MTAKTDKPFELYTTEYLPAVGKMTMVAADSYLETHQPILHGMVEEYEVRGGVHYYFLSDETYVTVSKKLAIHHDEMGAGILARFNR